MYVCLWSHQGGVPGHIHFVLQPVTREQHAQHGGGAYVQTAMFDAAVTPPRDEVASSPPARTLLGNWKPIR